MQIIFITYTVETICIIDSIKKKKTKKGSQNNQNMETKL